MSDETTKSVKVPRKKTAPALKPEKVKASLSLGVEVYQRLFVASVMSRRSASEIVEGLILDGLKTWALPANLVDRASKRQSNISALHDGPVNLEAEIAA